MIQTVVRDRRRGPASGVVVLALAVLLGGAPAPAQAPAATQDEATEESAESKQTQEPGPAVGPADPLDRGVPRSAMQGFLDAARSDDFEKAGRYLELPRSMPAARAPMLAQQLKIVLDRELWVDLETLSDQPGGVQDDGLPPGRDRVGKIKTKRRTVDIMLDRVRREDDGTPIWKISDATVARVPQLYEEFGYGPLGEWLPSLFFEWRLLEVQLWQWIGLATFVVLAYAVGLGVGLLFIRVGMTVARRTPTDFDEALLKQARAPLWLLFATLVFAATRPLLGLIQPVDELFDGIEKAFLIVAITWLIFRAVDVLSEWMSQRLTARSQAAAATMLPLGRRIVKAFLAAIAFLFMLQSFGVNVTTLLAGLGVGGLAVALAAQRTIENLFGGVTVIADEPVRVGDFCRFGDKTGIVEDIGLRSTRLRTLERTLVSVPNSEFSQLQLENYAKRDKFWYHPRLGLRYETTPDQIRWVLVQIRAMLYAHPKVDPDGARIRFVGFGAFSLDLDVFAYVRVADYAEFLEVQEDLNLRVMDLVEAAGTGFAFPSQTLYVGRDEGLPADKVREAEQQVATWRQKRELHLPRFPEQEVKRLGGTLDYPPEGSSVRPEQAAR